MNNDDVIKISYIDFLSSTETKINRKLKRKYS